MSLRKSDGGTILQRAKVTECAVYFTKQKHQKTKTWHDGNIKFYHFNKKIRLYDENDNLLAEEFIQKETQIRVNSVVTLNSYLVEIAEILNSFERDLSDVFPSKVNKDIKVPVASDNFEKKTHGFPRQNANFEDPIKHEIIHSRIFDAKCLNETNHTLCSTKVTQGSLKDKKSSVIHSSLSNSSNFKQKPISIRYDTLKTCVKNRKPFLSPLKNTFKSPIANKKTSSEKMLSGSSLDASKQPGASFPAKMNVEKLPSKTLQKVDPLQTNRSNSSNKNLSISEKYHLKEKSFFSKRRKSVLIIGLPSNNSTELSNSLNASCRRKRKQSLTKIMKLNGPRRPIEIPKEFLDDRSYSNSSKRSDGNESLQPNTVDVLGSCGSSFSKNVISLSKKEAGLEVNGEKKNFEIKKENKIEELRKNINITDKIEPCKPKRETADDISFDLLRNFNGNQITDECVSDLDSKSPNFLDNHLLLSKNVNEEVFHKQNNIYHKNSKFSPKTQQNTPPRSSAENFRKNNNILPQKIIDNQSKCDFGTVINSEVSTKHSTEKVFSNFSKASDDEETEEPLNSIMKRLEFKRNRSHSKIKKECSKKLSVGKTRLNNLSEYIENLNKKEKEERLEEFEVESGTQTRTYNFTKNTNHLETSTVNDGETIANDRNQNTEQRSFFTISKKMLSASIKTPNTTNS